MLPDVPLAPVFPERSTSPLTEILVDGANKVRFVLPEITFVVLAPIGRAKLIPLLPVSLSAIEDPCNTTAPV